MTKPSDAEFCATWWMFPICAISSIRQSSVAAICRSRFRQRERVHRSPRRFVSNSKSNSARDTPTWVRELGETRKLILASDLDKERKLELLHSLASREAVEAALAALPELVGKGEER